MTAKPTEVLELKITDFGAQADGIAEHANQPIYVPRTLPGETVRATLNGDRATNIEIITVSENRIEPICSHFSSCGGCAAQHVGETLYLSWKRDIVRNSFAHRGLEVPVSEVVSVPPASRRRAVFHASRQRDGTTLGFNESASHTIVNLQECPVMLPQIESKIQHLRRIAEIALAPGKSLRMTVTAAREGLDVGLGSTPIKLSADQRTQLADAAQPANVARLTSAGEIIVQRARPTLEISGASVELPPDAFTQATQDAEKAIVAIIEKSIGKSKRAADLFCGLGTFTFALANRARVLAIDNDQPGINALKTAAAGTTGIKPIETRVRNLLTEPLSRKELEGIDIAVFDPPRAGAPAQSEMLAKSRVPVVIAVSCNPATLARDVRILIDGGYQLESVTPIDQFIWSPHVEAVAVLRR